MILASFILTVHILEDKYLKERKLVMANKGVRNRVSVNAFENYYKSFKSNVLDVVADHDGVELKFCVKTRASLDELASAVDGAAESCFSNGKYVAWIKEYALRQSIIKTYTNIAIPENINRGFDFLFGTDIYEKVVACIDSEQLAMLVAAVDDQIEALMDENSDSRKQELDAAIYLLKQVSAKYNEFVTICSQIAGDDILALAQRLQQSAGNVKDEVAEIREKLSIESGPDNE